MSNAVVFAFLTLLYSCRVSLGSDELSRNYASNECGAKVIATNSEAEGTFKILSDSRDEYMLNPCKAKIWFVVELCEPIQPSAIELANFELYSSTPKEMQIQGSDKYPTQEWVQLGSFEASESRELQRFDIKSQSNYLKFIRIDLHSHYGSEHYCPVSLIRAFGLSLAEEFDTIENGGTSSPAPISQPTSDQVASNESVNVTGEQYMPAAAPATHLTPNDPCPAGEAESPLQSECGSQASDILFKDVAEADPQDSVRDTLASGPEPTPSPTPVVDETVVNESILSPTPVLPEVAAITDKMTATSDLGGLITPPSEQTPTSASVFESNQDTGSTVTGTQEINEKAAESPSPTAAAASVASVTEVSASPQPSPPITPPAPVVSVPPVLQGPAHVMNESSTGSVIAASSSKESIFIKLNNRIKALELNMSLNRETIESLLKKQEAFEFLVSQILNQTQTKQDEALRMMELQLKLNDISEQVYLLVSEKEVFHWQLIQVHIVLMVIEIATIIMIMSSYMRRILRSVPCQQESATPSRPSSSSRPVFKFRSSPEKSGLLIEHHPIVGSALFKKKRKRKKNKSKGPDFGQENLPPQLPPQPLQQQLQPNGKMADIG